MHSIETIAAAATGMASLGGQLPWAWFALLAVVDVALIATVVGRRHAVLPAMTRTGRPPRADSLVLRSGWRVPRSRVVAMRRHPAGYSWPLHSEYMVSRLV